MESFFASQGRGQNLRRFDQKSARISLKVCAVLGVKSAQILTKVCADFIAYLRGFGEACLQGYFPNLLVIKCCQVFPPDTVENHTVSNTDGTKMHSIKSERHFEGTPMIIGGREVS